MTHLTDEQAVALAAGWLYPGAYLAGQAAGTDALARVVLAWAPVVAAARAVMTAEALAAYYASSMQYGAAAKARNDARVALLAAVRALDGAE